jgi:thiamine pyrophosphokinase
LRRGENKIFAQSEFCGKYCGFFPVGFATKVTTQGLKWNLSDDLCSFEGLVSSSNEFDLSAGVNHVSIITENPLLWTMSINIGEKSGE